MFVQTLFFISIPSQHLKVCVFYWVGKRNGAYVPPSPLRENWILLEHSAHMFSSEYPWYKVFS